MRIGIKTLNNSVEKAFKGYIDRANAVEGYLKRVVVEQYRNIQRQRWMTENVSEGSAWEPLNASYAARKKKTFASYPGAGTKMLIATGKLQKSVIGPGEGYRQVTTPRSLTIASTIEYGKHVNEVRSFTTYSQKSLDEIRSGIYRFIVKNQIRIPRAF